MWSSWRISSHSSQHLLSQPNTLRRVTPSGFSTVKFESPEFQLSNHEINYWKNLLKMTEKTVKKSLKFHQKTCEIFSRFPHWKSAKLHPIQYLKHCFFSRFSDTFCCFLMCYLLFFHALFTVFFTHYSLFFSLVICCFFSRVIHCFFHSLFAVFSLVICCFFHALFVVFFMHYSLFFSHIFQCVFNEKKYGMLYY